MAGALESIRKRLDLRCVTVAQQNLSLTAITPATGTWLPLHRRMQLINGLTIASAIWPSGFVTMCSTTTRTFGVPKIWTRTAIGSTRLSTAGFGGLTEARSPRMPTGGPTATDIGPQWVPTAGPGLVMNPGDGRRTTTVAGSITTVVGPGLPEVSTRRREVGGVPHWSHSFNCTSLLVAT